MAVDMSVVPANDLNPADGIHPIDAGYDVMAQVWFSGMEKAGLQGWIKTPVDGTWQSGGSAKQKCNLDTRSAPIEIAPGVGQGDGPFIQSWSPVYYYRTWRSRNAGDIFPAAGGGFTQDWLEIGIIAPGVGAGSGVHFADINGDGKDDYLWVGDDGSVSAYLNTGAFPSWNPIGVIAPGVGAPGSAVGFADYLVINSDGTVSAWLNLGSPNSQPGMRTVSSLPILVLLSLR